jgi:hypothetical protein
MNLYINNISILLLSHLIQKYNPVLWINKNEEYYPMSIESYMNQSLLYCNKQLIHDREHLHNTTQKYGSDCYFQPISKLKYGNHNKTELNKDVPVYVYYKKFDYFIDIKYIYFYGYNGPYPLISVNNWFEYKYGEHYSDFEHITMRFIKDKNGKLDLHKIYYGAHTTIEGVWKLPTQIEWLEKRPVSYIALHGHGNYPDAGIYSRIFGFGNDYCQRGFLWKPQNIIYINTKNSSWHSYIGKFSKENEYSTLWSKTWGDSKPEINRSTNPLRRFFYLYYENYPKK